MRIGIFAAILIMAMELVSCQPAPQPVPQPAPQLTLTPSPTLAQATVSVPPTATANAAATATRVQAATPTPTSAPTIAPTVAPTVALLRVQVNSPDVGYLNVRDAPAISGGVVVQAKDGVLLDVLDAADSARGRVGQQGQWLKIRTLEGQAGFVAAWYVRLPGAAPAPALPSPTANVMQPDLSGAALDLFNRTNALRSQNGLAPYRYVVRLASAAERHSQDMADTGKIEHPGSDGSTSKQRIMDTGYGDWLTDEVIYGGTDNIGDAWDYWVSDSSHRAVLLNAQLLDIGISAVKGKGGLAYYTMDLGARPAQAVDPTPTPAPTPILVVPPTPTLTPNPALDVVMDLLNRTNALRAQNGLPPYRLSSKLNAAAERHSQDMSNTGNIDHAGSDGSTASRRIADTGYDARATGENIYGGQVTVDAAWAYWRDDPSHRANLLSAQFTEMGVSVIRGSRGWYYFTMDLAQPAR